MSKDKEIEQLRKQVEKEKEAGTKKAIGVAIAISGMVLTSLNHGEDLAVVGYIMMIGGIAYCVDYEFTER